MIDFHEILDRMNQNQRINFDKVFQRMARRWQQEGVKPRPAPFLLWPVQYGRPG